MAFTLPQGCTLLNQCGMNGENLYVYIDTVDLPLLDQFDIDSDIPQVTLAVHRDGQFCYSIVLGPSQGEWPQEGIDLLGTTKERFRDAVLAVV